MVSSTPDFQIDLAAKKVMLETMIPTGSAVALSTPLHAPVSSQPRNAANMLPQE